MGFFLQAVVGIYQCCGTDVSHYAAQQAFKPAPSSNMVLADIMHLPFAGRKFEVVIALDVLEHIPQTRGAASELGRVLVPGGLLVIQTPNIQSLGQRRKGMWWHGYRDPTHCSLLPPRVWESYLTEADLDKIDCFYDGPWDSPYLPLIPGFLQHLLVFKVPVAILLGLGFRFPESYGGNLILVARKPSTHQSAAGSAISAVPEN